MLIPKVSIDEDNGRKLGLVYSGLCSNKDDMFRMKELHTAVAYRAPSRQEATGRPDGKTLVISSS